MSLPLAGKVAVVTGTSPNIGSGIAIELGRAGAAVACFDVNADFARHAAGDIEALGRESLGLGVDVTDEAAVERAFDEVESQLGPVDILVNAAVWFNVKGLLDMPFDEWQRQLAVILNGAFLNSRAAIRRMVDSGRPGSVINLTSTAAHQGEPGNIGYCTGKSGLLNFTQSLAMEFAHLGIRVNVLTPTATDPSEGAERATRWGVAPPPPEALAAFANTADHIPLGKLPGPSDYGKAAVYLSSDAAAMVTGTDLRVDAGAIARYWRFDPAIHFAPEKASK
ncbi:MAG TPA: SDR family oxidoreductase [Acidimicrobiales bacterium]|jgi:NAD(P)-dependent dehydrogenase (short-subunit alcohol dehydrogenase family)|nr:SDR family oxidoreductase [Acidimicrobiales bacterium]